MIVLGALVSAPRICRADAPISPKTKGKLADLCDMKLEAIWTSITLPDTSQLPRHFYEQGVFTMISKRLKLILNDPGCDLEAPLMCSRTLEVAVVGKYEHQDAYISVFRAFEDAARACGVSLSFQKTFTSTSDCVCVPGGFGARGFEELVDLCQSLLNKEVPFLGICWGFQAAVVALLRDWGHEAVSQEAHDAEPPKAVVIKRDGLRKGAELSLSVCLIIPRMPVIVFFFSNA